jgi:hypothetical protein
MIKKTIRIDSRLKEILNELVFITNYSASAIVCIYIELYLNRAPIEDLILNYNACALLILLEGNHPNRYKYEDDFFSNNLFKFELKDCEHLDHDSNLTFRLKPALYDAVIELSIENKISFSDQILVILEDELSIDKRITAHLEIINDAYDLVIIDWIDIDDEDLNLMNDY